MPINSDSIARLAQLRAWMKQAQLDAFIVLTADPHNSEYLAPRWQCRAWLTGFDGSAGTAVVSLSEAALWTDSRYFLQAEAQLRETPFCLMREGEPTTPSITEWLLKNTDETTPSSAPLRIGCVAETLPYEQWLTLCQTDGMEVVLTADPFEQLWPDRPARPASSLYVQPARYAGCSARDKIRQVRDTFSTAGHDCDFYLLSDLAEIAWMLNLRGSDIDFNPVFLSYLLVGRKESILFIERSRVNAEIECYLSEQGVQLRGHEELPDFIAMNAEITPSYGIGRTLNMAIVRQLENHGQQRAVIVPPVVSQLKSRKNDDEIEGFRRAMLLDGVALVRFRRWLDETIEQGRICDETELSVGNQLKAYRAEMPEFCGLSFATIAGYAAHGAIVHYEATPSSSATLQPRGLLLLDSGAQYVGGTTDITRTIALGALTAEERRVYTLVLKGHIALARARFPEGTTGIQLDLAARYAMWQEGYDFGHGTGHGVGSHLCVHEGPQQIRKNLRECTTTPLAAGMTITDEPGIYLAGKFGVRIENILLVTEAESTDFGSFHRFETLTLCPIDTAPIDKEMLDGTERKWLDRYHSFVREKLLPLLDDEADRRWLIAATRPVEEVFAQS